MWSAIKPVALWVGKRLFNVGLKAVLDKNLRDRNLIEEVSDAIEFAERTGKEQGLKGQDKMRVALSRIKDSGVEAAKRATEQELRTLVEMKLDRIL